MFSANGGGGGSGKSAVPGKQTLVGALPAQMQVTATALNVRSAPSPEKHNIIGGLHHGQVIEAKAHAGTLSRRRIRCCPPAQAKTSRST